PTDGPVMLDAAGDRWRFSGLGCSQGEVAAGRARGYDVSELRREGLEPVGVDSTGQVAFGYRDRSSNRVQLGHASSLQAARVALDLPADAVASELPHRAFDTNPLVRDRGQ